MHSGMVEEEEEKKRLGENRKFKRLKGNIEEAEKHTENQHIDRGSLCLCK